MTTPHEAVAEVLGGYDGDFIERYPAEVATAVIEALRKDALACAAEMERDALRLPTRMVEFSWLVTPRTSTVRSADRG